MSLQRHKVAAIAVALMATPLLEATSNHTWVATNGSDGNPCTQSQPCLTFQTAVTVTTAGGILSVLSPGDFGPVTISHTITIDGGANGGTITFTGSQGINVSAAASDTVILRHLVVNGLNSGTDGILLAQAQHVTIEDCKIEGFTEYGLRVNSATNPISVAVKNTTITGGQVGVSSPCLNRSIFRFG
jgi:nitrous oxidase accessory protein NosD